MQFSLWFSIQKLTMSDTQLIFMVLNDFKAFRHLKAFA